MYSHELIACVHSWASEFRTCIYFLQIIVILLVYDVFRDIRGYVQDSRRIQLDYFNINILLHFQTNYLISENSNEILYNNCIPTN